MKGAPIGPAILGALPRQLLEFLAGMAMSAEDKHPATDYVPVRALAVTLHYDSELAVEMSGNVERFRSISAEVLLMGGSKCPVYLKAALDALSGAASWNTDRGGRPKPLAHQLRLFFSRFTDGKPEF